MSKTKSYNQIIFITTLSVYLGLVLVGASPQVLAQAALTNKFELKDQIEQKDDLDKKPDEQTDEFIKQYDILLTTLLKNSRVSNEYEIEISANAEDDTLLKDYLSSNRKTFFETVDISYQINSKEFVSKLKLHLEKNHKKTSVVFTDFPKKLNNSLHSAKNLFVLTNQNTEISFENNQVFIVTRLPRGSIDSLLK